MPDETMTAGISIEWIDSTEEPFDPVATFDITAVLEPEEISQSTYFPADYYDFYNYVLPPFIPQFDPLPEFEAPTRELIINIETTAVKPWEGRIVCIGVLDPNAVAPEALNFIRETELETLDDFLEWYEAMDYPVLIGYNVSFDYRFIYVACQKYRRNAPKFMEAELLDIMQQQKQVKQAFVYGNNPTGTLQNWADYALGIPAYASQKQMYVWIKEKNIEEITNFNADKLAKTYYLWVLDKVVAGTIPQAAVLARPGIEAGAAAAGTSSPTPLQTAEVVLVACPNCMQRQNMLKTDKVIQCEVCGTNISNPAL